VLEALSGTCTLYSRRRIGAAQLAADAAIAFLLVTAHAAVLMCEAILFSVAMNSARHALLALLIAANFVELKGQVYKRTDTNKLWALACMVRACGREPGVGARRARRGGARRGGARRGGAGRGGAGRGGAGRRAPAPRGALPGPRRRPTARGRRGRSPSLT
jgi:hypothetical protein